MEKHSFHKYIWAVYIYILGKGGGGGSSVVRHLPLVLEVPGSIPARGEKNFGVRTRFL